MSDSNQGIGICVFHCQNFQVHLLRLFEILDFAVGIGYSGQHGYVSVIVDKVLLPNIDCLMIFVQGLVAVSKTEQGIVVSGMNGKTF